MKRKPISAPAKAVREAVFRAFVRHAHPRRPSLGELLRRIIRPIFAGLTAGVLATTAGTIHSSARGIARSERSTPNPLQTPSVIFPLITNAALAEGDFGNSTMRFTVSRSSSPPGETAPFLVDYATVNGTALDGTDYLAASGTLRFATGQNSATIDVPIIGNRIFQSNRTFSVQLSNPIPDASFAPQTIFGLGMNSLSLEAADINGDGRTDLIATNYNSNNISVLLNATTAGATIPNFTSQVTFATGTGPRVATAADINGDGKSDVLVSIGLLNNTMTALLNTTPLGATVPSFSAPTTFGIGDRPTFITTADINGDGRPDALVGNLLSSPLVVSLNTTPPGATVPSFAPGIPFNGGGPVSEIAVRDVNGDGRTDVLMASYSTDTLTVLLNQTIPGATLPAFTPSVTFATGDGPRSMDVADVNGDGRPDAITASLNAPTISVLLNTTIPGATTPNFAPQTDFGLGSTSLGIKAADVNGDGRSDVLVLGRYTSTVSALINKTPPGSSTTAFAPPLLFPNSVTNGTALEIMDVNNDGRIDALATGFFSNFVSVLLDNRPPIDAPVSFAPQATFPVIETVRSGIFSDINGDGRPDILALYQPSLTLSVLFNQTNTGSTIPAFSSQITFTARGDRALAVGDINGDGRPDVLTTGPFVPGAVNILLNRTPPGATTPWLGEVIPIRIMNRGGTSIGVADVNGDGRVDVLATNNSYNSISVLLNQTVAGATIPTFAGNVTFATGNSPSSIKLADVNLDGKPDAIVANNGTGENLVSVLLNQTVLGTTVPNFSLPVTFAAGNRPLNIDVADIDGDGRPDALVSNQDANSISVLLNRTQPGGSTVNFSVPTSFATGTEAIGVTARDVNGDGRPDALVVNATSNNLSVLLNSTPPGAVTPNFAPQTTFAVGSRPTAVAVGDVNGDGRPDALVSNYSSGNLSVLLNTIQSVTPAPPAQAIGTIIDDDAPATIAPVPGTTPQSATVNSAFATPLAVDVRNAAGNLVQGVTVTFTAPTNGPSGSFPGGPTSFSGTTDFNGRITAPTFTANAIVGGPYQMTAVAAGGTNPGTFFSLTNLPILTVTQFYPVASTSGKIITIAGTGFSPGGTQVFFGGSRLIPATVQPGGTITQIQVVVPDSSTANNINGAITVRVGTVSVDSSGLPQNAANPGNPAATFPEFVLWGDADGNGTFNGIDVTLARAMFLGQVAAPTARQNLALDVSPANANGSRGDGTFAGIDVTFLRALFLGQIIF